MIHQENHVIVPPTERLSGKRQVMAKKAECSCGRLSFTVEGEPSAVCLFNCLAGQKYSGSAFGVSTYWPKSAVVQTSGESRLFRRISYAGRAIDKHFCPNCGDTVYWFVEFDEDAVGISVGVFEDPLQLRPKISYRTRSKQSCLGLSVELECLDTE